MASIVTDIKDFETCFHQHFEMLHHYAYTIVKDSDEAKDIVQAAFVKLWALYTNLEIKHSIIAPISIPWKLGQRHNFDCIEEGRLPS